MHRFVFMRLPPARGLRHARLRAGHRRTALCDRMRAGRGARPVALVAGRECRQEDRIRHQLLSRPARAGLLLWEMGVGDDLAKMPEGRGASPLAAPAHACLAARGDRRQARDIKFIAASHTHRPHRQRRPVPAGHAADAEGGIPWPLPKGGPRFNPAHPVTQIEGDHDVFGDGSAVLLATPGHTPGHQSFLLRLKNTGPILISGDAVHFRENWDFRRVPCFNTNRDQSLPRWSGSPRSSRAPRRSSGSTTTRRRTTARRSRRRSTIDPPHLRRCPRRASGDRRAAFESRRASSSLARSSVAYFSTSMPAPARSLKPPPLNTLV